jgi:hypothetical protein
MKTTLKRLIDQLEKAHTAESPILCRQYVLLSLGIAEALFDSAPVENHPFGGGLIEAIRQPCTD